MASRSWVSIVIFLAVVVLPLLSCAQAQQPQTPPRRNPPRAPPSPRRAPPPSIIAEPMPEPTPPFNVIPTSSPVLAVTPSLPPIIAPAQAPTPSSGGQCPKESIIRLSVCTKLDLSKILNNPSMARQDCCPPINSLSSNSAANCLCEAFKFNLGVAADVLFIKAALRVCGKASLGNINCLL